MRILFQGDSITDGNRYKQESQRWDLNHQIGHSYAYIIAGLLGLRRAGEGLEFVNRGISGDTSAGIRARMDRDILDIRPDLLSILTGINDSGVEAEGKTTAEEYADNISAILNGASAACQGLRVYLLEPFCGHKCPNEDRVRVSLEGYSAALREIAAARDDTVFIPLQAKFDSACALAPSSYWIWDGLHPTESGHALIAREWMRVFESEYPACAGKGGAND